MLDRDVTPSADYVDQLDKTRKCLNGSKIMMAERFAGKDTLVEKMIAGAGLIIQRILPVPSLARCWLKQKTPSDGRPMWEALTSNAFDSSTIY